MIKHGLHKKEITSNIDVFNTEIETALYKALSKFCIAEGIDLSWLVYDGFVQTINYNGSIELEWDFSARLNHKVELEYE